MPHDLPPTRCVSTRELSRNTAAILDQIRGSGAGFLILRYGRPIALLTPAPDDIFAGVADPNPIPLDVQEIDLTPEQRQFLELLSDGAVRTNPREQLGLDFGVSSLALTRLQNDGLVARPDGMYRITKHGLDVWRALQLAGDEVL